MKNRLPIVLATLLVLSLGFAWVGGGWRGGDCRGQTPASAKPANQDAVRAGGRSAADPGSEGQVSEGQVSEGQVSEGRLPESSTRTLSGQLLVQEAARQLLLQTSLEARTRQRLFLYGHQFLGSGIYRQSGPGALKFLQWEMKMEMNGQVTSIRQISDRRHLWISRNFPQRTQFSVVDLRRVQDAVPQGRAPTRPGAASPEAGRRAAGADVRLESPLLPGNPGWAVGGLSQLLTGLANHFEFSDAREGKLGEHPVWMVEGRWQSRYLQRLVPAARTEPEGGNPTATAVVLPPHVPHAVVLVLGRDPDLPLFPYRIEYLRFTGQAGAGQAGAGQGEPLLLMEFFEIRRIPLDPELFAFEPGDRPVQDETERYLEMLGLRERREQP